MLEKLIKILRHYLEKNYSTSRMIYFQELKDIFQKKEKSIPIVVYTNGKVASSTIEASIDKANKPVFHIHHLNEEYLSEYEKFVQKNYFRKPNRSNHLWRSLLWRPQFVRKYFLNQQPLKFIIVWRDPIAKNISTFFQWIKFREDESYFYFHSHQYEMAFEIKTPKDDLSELISYFLENFPHKIHENWLKIEQDEVLNLPYLQHEFDQSKNYQILEKGNNKVLTIKLENFGQDNYPKIIGDFCGIENFEYENANLTNEKEKFKAYKLFQEQIQLPESLLNDIYDSAFMKHFYSDLEINNLRKKWTK